MPRRDISGYTFEDSLSPGFMLPEEPISLDYAESDSAAEIDRGIRETITGIRISILAMGMGLANMKAKSLYIDLGCKTMAMYVKKLCDDMKMDRSSIFNWLYIGEAYLKYHEELRKIDFNDNDGPSKLPFLDRALEKYHKKEVFANIKEMTVRDFIIFAKGLNDEESGEKPFVTISEGRVYIDGILAVKINSRLDRRSYSYFRRINRIAGKAMENGEMIYPVYLRDMNEVKRYASASEYLIRKLRKDA